MNKTIKIPSRVSRTAHWQKADNSESFIWKNVLNYSYLSDLRFYLGKKINKVKCVRLLKNIKSTLYNVVLINIALFFISHSVISYLGTFY